MGLSRRMFIFFRRSDVVSAGDLSYPSPHDLFFSVYWCWRSL